MKKLIVFAVLTAFVLSAGFSATKSTSSTPSTGTAVGAATYSVETAANYQYQTSESNRIVTIGTKTTTFEGPILITSFGQSTDASMVKQAMKSNKDATFNQTATAADLAGIKTAVIVVGASTKGLGAAGISEAQETARAKEFMEAVKKNGIKVVCVHIGGATRRGALSDAFADMVLPVSSYILVKEDGNEDSKFTNYGKANNIPVTLILGNKDTVKAFQAIFN